MRASAARGRAILRLLLLVVAASAWAGGATAEALDLQGHRGARGLAPENTLAAFEAALRIGVSTLELDLGMSRDGVLVVSHDPRLDPDLTRGADGSWLDAPGPRLRELDLADIQRFDVGRARPGSRVAERFPDQRPADGSAIPTLEEVVALAGHLGADRVRFNVETKVSPVAPDEAPSPSAFARRLVEAIERLGIGSRTTVQSFDWRPLDEIRRLDPDLETACLTAAQPWLDTLERGRAGASPWLAGRDADAFPTVPELVSAAGCTIWSPYHEEIDAAAVRRAHELGLEVVVWTVNTSQEMARALDLGVDGMITDHPDRLRALLEKRGEVLPRKVGRSP